MEKPVITISRQFAAMGRTIAQKLARMLDIEFMDRDIVEEAAKRMNISLKEASSRDEEAGSGSFFMRRSYLFNFGVYNLTTELFETEKSIIRDWAEKGNCIIVGRLAEDILRKRPNTLRAYIYAPFDDRVANCVEKLQIGNEEEAVRDIKRVDAARTAFRRKFAHSEPGPENFDVMLSSSAFGIDGCAEILSEMARRRLRWD